MMACSRATDPPGPKPSPCAGAGERPRMFDSWHFPCSCYSASNTSSRAAPRQAGQWPCPRPGSVPRDLVFTLQDPLSVLTWSPLTDVLSGLHGAHELNQLITWWNNREARSEEQYDSPGGWSLDFSMIWLLHQLHQASNEAAGSPCSALAPLPKQSKWSMEARSASCRSLRSLPQLQCITNRGALGCDCCPRLYNFFSHRQFTVVLDHPAGTNSRSPTLQPRSKALRPGWTATDQYAPAPLIGLCSTMFSSHESWFWDLGICSFRGVYRGMLSRVDKQFVHSPRGDVHGEVAHVCHDLIFPRRRALALSGDCME